MKEQFGILRSPSEGPRTDIRDGDFLDGPVVKNRLPVQRPWFYLWSGKIPDATGQLSPLATTKT